MIGLLVLLGFLSTHILAFQPSLTSPVSMQRKRLKMSADGLESLYNSFSSKLESTFDLMTTDFTASHEVDTFNLRCVDNLDWKGASAWLSEKTGSKLTGVSKYHLKEGTGKSSRYNIEAWLGPGLMVPHLALSFGSDVIASGETVFSIRTDYIPRGPFPFGSDANYLELFYKHEMGPMPAHRDSHSASRKLSFNHRLLHSPIYFSGNNLPFETVSSLATAHFDRWLDYIASAKPLEARQKAGYNSRDDKLRQFAFGAHLNEYSAKYGKDNGRKLAAAFTGPLSEAYVGGGS